MVESVDKYFNNSDVFITEAEAIRFSFIEFEKKFFLWTGSLTVFSALIIPSPLK